MQVNKTESVPSWSLNSIYTGKYVTCQVVVSTTQRNIAGQNSWDGGRGGGTACALGMLREGLSEGKSLRRRQEGTEHTDFWGKSTPRGGGNMQRP